MNSLTHLKRNQIKHAAEVLARAFLDDPLYIAYFPDLSRRVSQNYHLMKNNILYCMKYGEIFITSPNLEGVALWQINDPKRKKQDYPFKLFINWINFSLAVALGKDLETVQSIYSYTHSIHYELVPSRHWYFFILGVDPGFQGKGYASHLIKPILTRIDNDHLPCYLDTNNEKNIELYQHFGFKTLKKYQIPGTDVTNWSMLRESPP
ncbi:MAG: GNAT family N-acetyltransferase [Promethearchaeota archaeon]|jgi:ribosomal protein S18 acetylase RimI-like enzyme